MSPQRLRYLPTCRRSVRRGIAATECAIILPTIILITFGTVQLCKAMLLKETATVAAYEAARVAIQYEGTSTAATNRAMQIISDRNVSTAALSGSVVTITPDPTTAAPLTPLYVTVRLPCSGNLIFPGGGIYGWMGSSDVAATVVMLNEYKP
jgi:Flp pilus assembly protein TadG